MRKIKFVNGEFYHVCNRGVDKRSIFENQYDVRRFYQSMEEFNTINPIGSLYESSFLDDKIIAKRKTKRLVNIVAYCLNPNHYHLVLEQLHENGISQFMHRLNGGYTWYFNKKYQRIGGLFQGPYKAILITDDNYLLHLSRYIHLNPSEYTDNLTETYSSYADYLGLRKTKWVKPDFILNFFNKEIAPEFKKVNSYKDFVENYNKDPVEILGNLTLED